jgi:uncharacterized protein
VAAPAAPSQPAREAPAAPPAVAPAPAAPAPVAAAPAQPAYRQEPAPPAAARPAAMRRSVAARPAGRARIAIVIDDVGNNLRDLDPLLQIPGPMTFAVLPELRASAEAARRAHAAGKEVIVHMPMEPLGDENPGLGAILVAQSDAEIRERLERALAQIPQAGGINNHMGSRAEADPRVMAVVMETLKARGLFFLDSRTTAETVAPAAALAAGVPLLERTVFLDNVPETAEVEASLREGLASALERGSAVFIGHAQSAATREVLARMLPQLDSAAFERVPLAGLIP